ncbi:MAG: hypothetical protein ABWY16_00260 [Pedobacter sp.]|uniref:hypothetical protein n=1 Tax=Pedobacter sp. TaxID=1411316 RepID=UPI0033930740
MEKLIYEGAVYWAYDTEILAMDVSERYLGRHFSSVPPLSKHQGRIYLTNTAIFIEGDEEASIPLSEITQISLDFDEVFSAASVKNFGMFWKPLRITYGLDSIIYLIVDYSVMISNNKRFFELLTSMLA